MAAVLIVDDDAAMRDVLVEAVRDFGYEAHLAVSGDAALELLDRVSVSAVLLDLRMPGMDGLEVLRRIRARPAAPVVAVLTAHATSSNTIEAMRLGAFDHLTKPIGRDELKRVIDAMLAAGTGSRAAAAGEISREALVGSSEAIRAVQKRIGMLADSDATVLVTGETGTGKELVARAIHEHGNRRKKPFVAVNCAAIPAELLESELFGHVRGAFTGAASDRSGAFRDADGGTLFLDEIGDMDVLMQAKILRALQERIVTPVGGKPVAVDVRVITATHRDLPTRVREGRFREDLYYRLNVVPIHLPPLRERPADIEPLANHFVAMGSRKTLSADAMSRLSAHAWPGNVRELRNAIDRAVVLARGGVIDAADFDFLHVVDPSEKVSLTWPDEDLPTATAHLEALLIRRTLRKTAGNRSEAARQLNIHRQLLHAKMKRYGIDASEFRTEGVSNPDTSQADDSLEP